MRHCTILLALLVAATPLAGCASSPQSLRDHPGKVQTFVVNADYETVYARIVEPMRAEVVPAPLSFGSDTGIDADMYPNKRVATISAWYTGFGRNYPLVIDIKEPTPNQTQVRICYANIGGWPSLARRVEAWANGR